MDLRSLIRDVPDFPKEGVIFKDITLLLQNPDALKETTNELFKLLNGQKIDKVVGMESRGFIFGPMLASKLNAGFVPIRKPGKLPSTTLSETYNLEYGTDTLEIHIDAIEKGDKVLIHDDVLATGGTANAACKLIERLGGEIVQCNFLIELTFLNGSSKMNDYSVQSLLKY
ncbi:MAG: adenine phosphoribosyltransferase [Maribacter arcticus]|jgi:adenine phosphoribosyltransferase|uniref:adenine phosphoribosyltransferase n=1 Tax=Maribacter arcticus TaxID=561365 RepID=UPI003002319F